MRSFILDRGDLVLQAQALANVGLALNHSVGLPGKLPLARGLDLCVDEAQTGCQQHYEVSKLLGQDQSNIFILVVLFS